MNVSRNFSKFHSKVNFAQRSTGVSPWGQMQRADENVLSPCCRHFRFSSICASAVGDKGAQAACVGRSKEDVLTKNTPCFLLSCYIFVGGCICYPHFSSFSVSCAQAGRGKEFVYGQVLNECLLWMESSTQQTFGVFRCVELLYHGSISHLLGAVCHLGVYSCFV